MLKSQEPKYECLLGRLFNRESREQIPDDEPVFILRAKDLHAITALRSYLQACADSKHQEVIARRIDDFERFADMHPERMKEPDTRLSPSEEESR